MITVEFFDIYSVAQFPTSHAESWGVYGAILPNKCLEDTKVLLFAKNQTFYPPKIVRHLNFLGWLC